LSNVSFETAPFESWDAHGRKFALVLAAQSWHWVDARIGVPKAARVLTPNGCIALLSHAMKLRDVGLQAALDRCTPAPVLRGLTEPRADRDRDLVWLEWFGPANQLLPPLD
jgi:SAM-dependent methyltransferase